MSLRIVHSASSAALWRACVDRFLDQLKTADHAVARNPAALWLTHRLQRDALHREAATRSLAGWLGSPVAFFSDLPDLFGVTNRPIGLLERRMLVGQLAAQHGENLGIQLRGDSQRGGMAGSGGAAQVLDRLFGELLPEEVTPEQLNQHLSELEGDAFAGSRSQWVVAVYRDYLARLESEGRYDPRSIHATVAERIRGGQLRDALSGARELHIYGLTSLRTRRGLIEALRDQDEVHVFLYLPALDPDGEWSGLLEDAEVLEPEELAEPVVQPAPDARRELEWVAGRVKELLVRGAAEPHEIAVIARIGREDARRAHEIFQRAGIPNTARIRSPLAEIPALKAILHLFRGAATDWTYRPLRHVLESPYFDTGVDLRPIDRIAGERRVQGLEGWADELERLRVDATASAERAEDPDRAERRRAYAEGLKRTRDAFDEFADTVRPLGESASLDAWIDRTLTLLQPGRFEFRRNLCRPGVRSVAGAEAAEGLGSTDPTLRSTEEGVHWEVVRMDQRGVENLRRLLEDWKRFDPDREVIGPGEWYGRLRRFLESNELALSTPLRTGVQILEAHEAALFPFRHTFVIHANDGEFPRRPPVPAIFSDEERRQLAAAGLPLTHRELWMERERALWDAVTTVPNVTISYRTADARGTPLLPSLTVPEHDEDTEIPRTRFAWEQPFSRVHGRRTAAAELTRLKRQRKAGGVRLVQPAALHHALLAAYAESQRGAGLPSLAEQAGAPGPWNGELRDPALLEELERRFGDERAWSASQLELYAGCPFHFLVQRVLHLDEREEAEEETSPLAFGSVAHDLLEAFYRALDGAYPASLTGGETAELFDRIADEVFADAERRAREGETWLGLPALWAVTRKDLREKVREYVAWELGHMAEKGERPYDFEVEFGYGDGEPVTITGFDLDGAERALRLVGRIDRVDRTGDDDDPLYHILDYKSSSTPRTGGYKDGGVLQAPLYMSVLTRLHGLNVKSGRYRAVKSPGDPQNGGRVVWGGKLFERAMRIAFSIPARIRAGLFEAKAAKSSGWRSWLPGPDICRTEAQYDDYEPSRFD